MPAKPKPAPKIKGKPKKKKTNRQKLVLEISDLCRKITTWRDGCTCVLAEVDGGRCDDVSQWGHVIPQGSSGFLKHSLSNSFRQCKSHNGLHVHNQIVYLNWYSRKFGKRAFDMLTEASKVSYHKFYINDLWDIRDNLNILWDNRATLTGACLNEMIYAGYYGDIIREAWIKDGRI